MDLHFSISAEFIKNLQRILGLENSIEVMKNAVALLDWVVERVKRKQVILSFDIKSKTFQQLKAPWSINISEDFDLRVREKDLRVREKDLKDGG
jgi:hypothetical protein